jgi:hypothetical protein
MDMAKRSVEYPPPSPDLKPLDFYLWGDLKNTVCIRKPRTLQDLKHKTEIASTAIPPAALQEVCHSVACFINSSMWLVVDILNIYDFNVTTETKV